MLHITSARFTNRTQATTSVKIYSNASEVELSVNGISYGKKAVDNGTAVWKEVKLTAGSNAIHAEALIEDKQIQDNCQWTLN